jgi:hypothetical protein
LIFLKALDFFFSVDPLRFPADQQKGKSIFPLRSLRLCGELFYVAGSPWRILNSIWQQHQNDLTCDFVIAFNLLTR